MATLSLTESQIIKEFQDFDIDVKYGSPLLDKLHEIGVKNGLDASSLCENWVAFSTQHDCDFSSESLDRLEAQLHSNSRKTPTSRRTVSKTTTVMYTQDDVGMLFGADDELIGAYATPEDKERLRDQKRGQKRVTTPTTPASKSRHTQNGATPVTPASTRTLSTSTPLRTPTENDHLPSTPAVKYSQRKTSGSVVCSLNDDVIPSTWRRGKNKTAVDHYDKDIALKGPYQFMFQKISDRALAVIDRIEELGNAICQHNSLPDPLPVAQPSLEPAVYTGQVVCDGEGHLNARSCLLEGPVRSRRCMGAAVRLEIPDSMRCSLFPGQVIAVEGVNNYHGVLIPSTIHDEGVLPPLPKRNGTSIAGFTMVAAAGPFTTSDSLDMEPLYNLLEVVKREKPNVLLLFGPYVDITHEMIKDCMLPVDGTFEDFFKQSVLSPIQQCIRHAQTELVMLPSQKDVHHPFSIYPQPPFHVSEKDDPTISFVSDPATLSINDLCFGLTSTDILFHLSARTMFKGSSGDRMTRLTGHILQQQCYYPLIPPFQKEDHSHATTTKEEEEEEEHTEVNLDLIHAFDCQHAMLPVKPDVMVLPSDLKPFVKRVDSCICINPGRLTKKASGGTYAKICVPDIPMIKPDFSSDIGVQVLHI